MRVPDQCRAEVQHFARDFRAVTHAWVAQGHHTADEVEAWRAVIRQDMETEAGVDPAIDNRPREVRIRAWCKTFRAAMERLGGGNAGNGGEAGGGKGRVDAG